MLRNYPDLEDNGVEVQLSAGRLSSFFNFSHHLCPTLGRVMKTKSRVFAVGLFSGNSKPQTVGE